MNDKTTGYLDMLKYDCFNKNMLHTIFFAFLFILPLAFSNSLLSIYDIRTPEVYAQSTEGDIDAEDVDAEDVDGEAGKDLIESKLSRSDSSSSNSNFNFAAAGDFGCEPETKRTIDNILSRQPEVVLALGDLSYEESTKCWFDLAKPIDNIIKVTLGNEEQPMSRMSDYINHYNLDKPYYSFNYGNVHFLSIATEFDYHEGSEQYQFVVEDLKAASSNPNIKWIVAFYHGPMFTENSDMDYETLRDIYAPLFDQYKVDLALQGHVHNYHRTFPLQYNEDDPEDPIINSNGTIYTVVGSAGASLEDFEDYPEYIGPLYFGYGFLDVQVTSNEDSSILHAIFYDNDGIIQDDFSITKLNGEKVITGNKGKDTAAD
jgi:Calcineurin-like phosphoesterase